jgi:hypothetical protein
MLARTSMIKSHIASVNVSVLGAGGGIGQPCGWCIPVLNLLHALADLVSSLRRPFFLNLIMHALESINTVSMLLKVLLICYY